MYSYHNSNCDIHLHINNNYLVVDNMLVHITIIVVVCTTTLIRVSAQHNYNCGSYIELLILVGETIEWAQKQLHRPVVGVTRRGVGHDGAVVLTYKN